MKKMPLFTKKKPKVFLGERPKKSNTVIVMLVGFAPMFIVGIWWTSLRPEVEAPKTFLSLFSIPFFAHALAQLRSGYFWQNMRPGNRGAHHSEKPQMFLRSNLFHIGIGFTIMGLAFYPSLRSLASSVFDSVFR